MGVSAWVATLVATGVVIAGLGLRRWSGGHWLWLVFLLPGVLLGIGMIFLFNRPPFTAIYQSLGVVVLALILRYLAWGWTGARTAGATLDRDLVDAARLMGATRWQQFRIAVWPQMAPHLAATWYLVFLLALWDVETLVLIVPPGKETLALRVFNLLHYGHNPQVNGLCLLLLLLAVAPLLLWEIVRLVRHRQPRNMASVVVGGLGLLLLTTGCELANPGMTRIESRFFSSVEIIGSRGNGAGQFNKPRSVAVDRESNLYVVDMTGRVQKFSADGAFLLQWQMPQTDKGRPKGMGTDPEGNIIVVEPHYSRVNHFAPDGRLMRQWGRSGTNAGELAFPRAVAVNSRGELLVSEYGVTERVQRFDPAGQRLLQVIGQEGSLPGEFSRPEGLGVDALDRVYIADSCNHRIQFFSPHGHLLGTFGKAGTGIGEMSYPYDVRVDAEGRVYVCEFGNSRIQVFDPEHRPIEVLGGPGSAPEQLSNPWSIALDPMGNLYVADAGNHRVVKYIRNQRQVAGAPSESSPALLTSLMP
jgi:ABC-type spermidine/putrescine transport system permease subunit II/DNA-binding beta-propeller fold protein YncE